MEPARHHVPKLDAEPPPIVPEPDGAPVAEVLQSGAPGPSSTAAADEVHEANRYNAPAHSTARSPSDMLPPALESSEAPGRLGLAADVVPSAATHRLLPIDQSPEPSEHFSPPVPDDRKVK